jgi:hypothetical protein
MTRQTTKQKPRAEFITFRRLAVIHDDNVQHLVAAINSGDREARAIWDAFLDFQHHPRHRGCIMCDSRMDKVGTTLVILGDEHVLVLGYCTACSAPYADPEDWTGAAVETLGRLGLPLITVGHS